MRILCLHDQYSSAPDLSKSLHKLEEKLRKCHRIELTYVNSPLVVNQTNVVNDKLPKRVQEHSTQVDKRIWFDENKVGLDASILNLRQIWSHSLHSNPFSGILGFGQGAAIAALIPHLRFQSVFEQEGAAMFEGLRFCTFIHGWDILASMDSLNECYDDVQHISTLHISNESDTRGRILFHRYGGKKDCSSAQDYFIEDELSHHISSREVDVQILNKIGKYFVAQKKSLLSEQKLNSAQYHQRLQPQKAEEELDSANLYSNNNELLRDEVEPNEQELVMDAETTRMKIAHLECKAISLLNSSIVNNPPKALMAVISPNDDEGNKFVGGWAGPKDAFRSSGFKESGGAPCPKDFTFSIEERILKLGEQTDSSK